MSRERPLRGGCACGRNAYIIEVPPDATEVAQVLFDRTALHRRSLASPLSAWLRVPLSWYHSTTYAFFDDESHHTIRRTYTSPIESNAKRAFCGFCGTPLTYWSERTREDADYISLALGSLSGEDLQDLDDLGLLPKELTGSVTPSSDVDEREPGGGSHEPTTTPANPMNPLTQERQTTIVPELTVIGRDTMEAHARIPWFESMLQGSHLGRVKRTKGAQQSRDGRTRVQWEIVEILPDDGPVADTASPGKRKIDVVDASVPTIEEAL